MRTGWLLFLAACGGETFNGPAGGSDNPSGPYPTELAVENISGAPITVTFATGDDTETFEAVAAGTSSESRVIEWEFLDTVTVTIDDGAVQGGTIDLAEERTNLVRLTEEGPPSVQSDTPDPGGNPGGNPGGGGGGGGW